MSSSETQQTTREHEVLACATVAELTIDRVVSLMPGFVYVFNHLSYSNDYTNHSVAQHLGYSSEEIRRFGQQMFMHLVHKDDHALLGAHLQRITQLLDDESEILEYRVTTKQGAERWLRSVDRVFDRGPDGQVMRHIGYASDVTAEKQAKFALSTLNAELENQVAKRTADLADLNKDLEERISLRNSELEGAVQELEQLTFIATHDLKVPANNLSRLARMLGDNAVNMTPDQAEQVGWINVCAEQLHQKIQGLVLVAQLRLSGAFPCQPLNLNSQVQAIVEELQKTGGGDALPITCDIPDDLVIEFSKFELGSIVTSMLDNALKYAALHPLRITVRAWRENGRAVLTVADNGVGVDGVREHAKVFGLFQRAHKTPAGSGISLYCAQRMLQHRGGTITVSGQRGVGAEFKIVFPLVGELNATD